MDEYTALRRRFLDEQAEAAREEARDRFVAASGGRSLVYRTETSPWVVALVAQARRVPCVHAPRAGSDLVLVSASVPRWLCRGCAERAVVSPLDAARCDVCRDVADPLVSFMVHSGTVLVEGKHCEGCRSTVEVVDR